MRRKGVCYDVGRVMLGRNWRPDFDPKVVHRELEIIKKDLHCNAVRIQELDLDRLAAATEDALQQGLEVWFSPEMWDRGQDETRAYVVKGAKRAEEQRAPRLSGSLSDAFPMNTHRNPDDSHECNPKHDYRKERRCSRRTAGNRHPYSSHVRGNGARSVGDGQSHVPPAFPGIGGLKDVGRILKGGASARVSEVPGESVGRKTPCRVSREVRDKGPTTKIAAWSPKSGPHPIHERGGDVERGIQLG